MDYKQVIEPESQETNINIDYYDKKLRICTNKATVMNRLTRLGYIPTMVERLHGEVCSMTFQFETKDKGKFLRTTIFKFDV